MNDFAWIQERESLNQRITALEEELKN